MDDPLARWRPDFPNADAVTVRQLLQHTSGLHDCTENPKYLPALRADFGKVWTPEDCFALMGEPYFAPGSGWHYSNTNYQLLGVIVEEVTGEPFGRALRSRIMDPLGLESTWYDATEDPGRPRAHAFLDIDGDGSPEDLTALVPNTSFITAAGAAGAVVTTAEDLARFGHAVWTGDVLDEPLFREMTTWVERGDGMEYGLGVIRDAREGRAYLGHKGNTAGYSAALWHDVEAGLTVAVLTNAHLQDVTPVAMELLERAR